MSSTTHRKRDALRGQIKPVSLKQVSGALSLNGYPANAIGRDHNLKRAFIAFFQKRAFRFFVMEAAGRISNAYISGAENLKAIVEVRSRSEALRAEAGAGVIDFEQINGLSSVVANGCRYIVRVAAQGGYKEDKKGCGAEKTHGLKSNRMVTD